MIELTAEQQQALARLSYLRTRRVSTDLSIWTYVACILTLK
jgi:hypothetical protein